MKLPAQRKLLHLLALVCSLGLLGCSGRPSAAAPTLNQNAALPGDLPMNPLPWRVITSMADKTSSTMSTLYGNDLAVDYARAHSDRGYPDGSALALVTWTQRNDPRWYGAKIPARVSSVEFLTVGALPDGHATYSYLEYSGAPLKQASAEQTAAPSGRALFLLAQRAAVLP
jgi:cytochrome P460